MLKAALGCTPSCQLHRFCQSSLPSSAKQENQAVGFRQYCRNTRRLTAAALLMPVLATAGIVVSRILT